MYIRRDFHFHSLPKSKTIFRDEHCFQFPSRAVSTVNFFCISTMPRFRRPLQTLRRSPAISAFQSLSDTGVGSCVEEFEALKLCREAFGGEIWDGLLSVTTTGFGDNEIYHYEFNLKEAVSARRLTRLPSNPKNGQKFSGTEVCLSIFESVDVLLGEISRFFQKNVAIQLVAEHGDVPGSRYESVLLANEWNPLPFSASNLERLKSGLEDYVFKHGNTLGKKCESCFSNWEHLKVGTGVACHTESRRYSESVTEAVIVISEISEIASTCLRTCGAKTEVLYFKDFSPCPISQSSVKALTSIDWKSYGLTFGGVVEQGGYALLKWDNLPPYVQINISLHHYHNQVTTPSARLKMQPDQKLVKKAVKFALNDLKDKHAGVLLSAHALKVRDCAPDLAKTISSLILCSNDSNFREECFSFLGLPCQGVGSELVEDCIKEKIISVIDMNDREQPQRSKEVPTFLFEDDHFQDSGSQDEEYEGEDAFTSMDI
ncbi:type 2 DNA topoisomerase 6 subunit B-like isoform X3 [Rosa chinensis]|uniref:type 2 DNA topoisomerase 6 subunit B-like isoform X3 n=1 Tax=Rosa chinensis TaxID=74649 RepID=UPI001AD8B056|nr:type 2 DNA topoisomerase 6 subunit B-like isoform X3 [Rosa chinensis]